MQVHRQPLHGVMAEFDHSDRLIAAVKAVRSQGYTQLDAYTPYPIEALHHALGHHHSPLPRMVLAGGITGALGGFLLQTWTSTMALPLNVGGKPYFSWPAFIPVTFECTILLASLTAVLGMLALSGLPRPHHPVFNVERFAMASRDRYFLCIEAGDPLFDTEKTSQFLWTLEPTHVAEVAES